MGTSTEQIKIGIDPGLGGAIAILHRDIINIKDHNEFKLFDMPKMDQPWANFKKDSSGKLYKKQMVDIKELSRILEPYAPIYINREKLISVNIENVHAQPGNGAASAFTFGGAVFSILTVLTIMGFKPNYILPVSWKKRLGLIAAPKDEARQIVINIFPELKEELKRKKDVDKAEAILIALYDEDR